MHIFARFCGTSLGGMEGMKGEKSEDQSDGAENHQQHEHGFDLECLDVQNMRLLIKSVSSLISKGIFLLAAGSTFSQKSWQHVTDK